MSDVHLLIILFHFQSSPYSRTHVRIYTNTSELTHSFALNSSVRVIIFMCSVVPENNKSGPYSAFPIPIYHAYMLKMLNTHTCKTFTAYIYTRARTPTLKKIHRILGVHITTLQCTQENHSRFSPKNIVSVDFSTHFHFKFSNLTAETNRFRKLIQIITRHLKN